MGKKKNNNIQNKKNKKTLYINEGKILKKYINKLVKWVALLFLIYYKFKF